MSLKESNKNRRKTDMVEMTKEEEIPKIINHYLGYVVIGVIVLALLVPFIA